MLTPAKKGDNELMKHANSHWADDDDKKALYLDRYLFLYEGEAKPLSKITKSEMYDAIVDFFNDTPWAFYTMLSPETFAYLKDATAGKGPRALTSMTPASSKTISGSSRDFLRPFGEGRTQFGFFSLSSRKMEMEKTRINWPAVLSPAQSLEGDSSISMAISTISRF
jgi:hypothetical protein